MLVMDPRADACPRMTRWLRPVSSTGHNSPMITVTLGCGEVSDFGSRGVHMIEPARLDPPDEFRVHLATYTPGSLLGRHPTRLWQMVVGISGAGWVAGQDGERRPLEPGQAIMWSPGEEHESGSDDGMTVAIVQSSKRLPYGRQG